jgi:hypothetical protein
MYYFTTYFDTNYLSRGLILYDSLKKHSEEFKLYVLCLDQAVFDFFGTNADRYPEVLRLTLAEIEEADHELLACKSNRNKVEYYFTLSPCLPLYLLKKYSLPHICSLDGDIMFFSSPAPIFDKLDFYSIIITAHDFIPELRSSEIFGIYNVSFQIFKNDDEGLECLKIWRNNCINWCYDRLEDGKFADQKYLDSWPKQFKKILADNVPGAGAAPWNIKKYKITTRNGEIFLNNDKLIFFHYQGLRIVNECLIRHNLGSYKTNPRKMLIREIYKPYVESLMLYQRDDSGIERLKNPGRDSILKYMIYEKDWFLYYKSRLFTKSFILKAINRILLLPTYLLHNGKNN